MRQFSTPVPPHAGLSRFCRALLRLETTKAQTPRRPPSQPNKKAQ
jgi:hypothetical protein